MICYFLQSNTKYLGFEQVYQRIRFNQQVYRAILLNMRGEKRKARKYKHLPHGSPREMPKRRPTPRVIIDVSDPHCASSSADDSGSDMEKEDSVDGMPVLKTVRWKRPSNNSQDSVRLNPSRAKLLKSIRHKSIEGVKQQIKHLGGDDLTVVEDEHAITFLEHAVRSGSPRIVEELIEGCETDSEKSKALVRALQFAIKDNDIKMAAHLVRIHRAKGFCVRAPYSISSKTEAEFTDTCHIHKHPRKISQGSLGAALNEAISNIAEREKEGPGEENNGSVRHTTEGNEGEGIELRKISLHRDMSEHRTISTMLLLHDSEYAVEMTPIVMAAQLERTEIIRLLIDDCCPDIHPLTQVPTEFHDKNLCYVCNERVEFIGIQSIENCRKAIEVYKALSSPAYMFQAGVEDPILEAFNISNLMERRKVVDPAFVDDYDAISKKCKTFATDLLGLCRSCPEVHALLQHSGGISDIHARYHTPSYPRIMVAAYFDQKEFIGHPHTQQVLQNVWYKGLPAWVCQTHCHFYRVLLYSILLAIGMPFIMLLYMFRIPKVEQLVRPPVNKFFFDVITYIIFLALLFANDLRGGLHTKGVRLSTIEIFILLWLIGYSARLIRVSIRRRCYTCYHDGSHMTNWLIHRITAIVFFWLYFGMKIVLYVMSEAGSHFDDRRTWPWYDPLLWCEAVYAVAVVLTVMQMYTFFRISSNLGPLQISLKKMMYDVMSFMILFAVILSAFAIGLSSIYTGYGGYEQVDPMNPKDITYQPMSFSSLGNTYTTLFWNIFGYGDEESARIVVDNRNVTRTTVNGSGITVPIGEVMKHTMTQAVGNFLYGIYHIAVVIVLINMLIAMMANSYNRIEKNSLTEWRFARTTLITSYMNEMGVLVPPFNILPFRYLLGFVLKKSPRCFRNKQSKREMFQNSKDHKEVMDNLSRRYWRRREALHNRDKVYGGLRHSPSTASTSSTGQGGKASRA